MLMLIFMLSPSPHPFLSNKIDFDEWGRMGSKFCFSIQGNILEDLQPFRQVSCTFFPAFCLLPLYYLPFYSMTFLLSQNLHMFKTFSFLMSHIQEVWLLITKELINKIFHHMTFLLTQNLHITSRAFDNYEGGGSLGTLWEKVY